MSQIGGLGESGQQPFAAQSKDVSAVKHFENHEPPLALSPNPVSSLSQPSEGEALHVPSDLQSPAGVSAPEENKAKLSGIRAKFEKIAQTLSPYKEILICGAGLLLLGISIPVIGFAFAGVISVPILGALSVNLGVAFLYAGVYVFNIGRLGNLAAAVRKTLKSMGAEVEGRNTKLQKKKEEMRAKVQNRNQLAVEKYEKRSDELQKEITSVKSMVSLFAMTKEALGSKTIKDEEGYRATCIEAERLLKEADERLTKNTTPPQEITLPNEALPAMKENHQVQTAIQGAQSGLLAKLSHYIKQNKAATILYGIGIALVVAAGCGAIFLSMGTATIPIMGALSVTSTINFMMYAYYFWGEAKTTEAITKLQDQEKLIEAQLKEIQEEEAAWESTSRELDQKVEESAMTILQQSEELESEKVALVDLRARLEATHQTLYYYLTAFPEQERPTILNRVKKYGQAVMSFPSTLVATARI